MAFSGSHAREPLELDHRCDVAVDVIEHRIDMLIRNRLDPLALWSRGSASTKSADSLESVVDLGRDQLVLCRPLEKAFRSPDVMVHHTPCKASIDHSLTTGLEGNGAKRAS